MNTPRLDRRRALALAGAAWVGSSTQAIAQHPAASPHESPAKPPAAENRPKLPPPVTTQHVLTLPNRVLHFTATAGAIPLTSGEKHTPLADIAFVAYQRDGTDRDQRPVTFVFNGGPGFASAWLQLGAVGPWRIPLGTQSTSPSATPVPSPNSDTWLDFTDLVFIDPAGTGYSQALVSGEQARQHLWSVDGDITYLAEAIRRWIDRYNRMLSPKYILGESYGGFRAPRLAYELATKHGTGVRGLALVSPALEIISPNSTFEPFYYVTRLPSMAAAARGRHGAVTRAQLADVEAYAATDYLVDVVRGERDAAAIDRRSARVAAFTGLDPTLVRRHHGLIDNDVFLHALYRSQARVGSVYDATISDADPYPLETLSSAPDPILDGLQAPVSSAMVAVYENKLRWRPETTYRLGNLVIARQWDWGQKFGGRPESLHALREALALDGNLSVLIGQGMFDLVVPYFQTQLILDQIPESVGMNRVRFTVHNGGHMFYMDDPARAALREDAAALIGPG
ncbi:MAG TPA: septum formation initiator [Acetobacteraceae bacterium]|nr:septum formation initiator [Acetobacteraceae bacterium]